MPNLLDLRSYAHGTDALVETPDGSVLLASDPDGWAAVSEVVGEPVEIRPEGSVAHKDDSPVHIITTASLRWAATLRTGFDDAAVRYRPNLVIDVAGVARVEEAWIGKRLQVGSCVLRVTKRTERCVMPTLPQEDLPFLSNLLAALTEASGACLGVYAEVERPGALAVGDPMVFLP